ncbi:MAG TPA: hypothetical protein VLY65_00560 [Nitrososphaerales archaeon]|nr:hypothetical protein [Nitrososphaerales archaeon]
MPAAAQDKQRDKKLEDILRLIELCRNIQSSSVNPFEIDIREKLLVLKQHFPDWKAIDVMLKDSEAMSQLVAIVKLQDQWLKHRASALYIDPLLLELKIQLISKEELAESFAKCWHPIAQIDQLTPRGLEKAFIYWRELVPFSERFKDQFGNFGEPTGMIGLEELESLSIFTKEEFQARLNAISKELVQRSNGKEIDYRDFIKGNDPEETALRGYLIAFVITEGSATLRIDPLTEQIFISTINGKPDDETKSVAIVVR